MTYTRKTTKPVLIQRQSVVVYLSQLCFLLDPFLNKDETGVMDFFNYLM